MRYPRMISVAALCLSVSLSAAASKPITFKPGEKGVSATGEKFRSYTVTCSDKKVHPLTSWKYGKQWCVGHLSADYCSKKRIKAAKRACNQTRSTRELSFSLHKPAQQ